MLAETELQQAVAFLESGDWKSAHQIVQKDEQSPLACWAHGIVHLMEGDVPNARYWYREAGRPFPAEKGSDPIQAEIRALSSSAGIGRAKR